HRGAHLQAAAAQRQTARQPEEAWQLGGIAAAGRWRNENKHSSDCPTRFTSEADRKTREDTMREIGHFVGGKEVKGTSGRFGDVFNPNTGEVQAHVAFASKSEVERAIEIAAAAQPAWAALNPQRRARVLFKFLELAQKEFDTLAKLLSSEHGKTVADSKGDL